MELDIHTNRVARKYGKKELVWRLLWCVFTPLFRFSPRPLFGWRRFLLKLFGARIGKHAHIYNTATIYMPWNLEIGDWAAIGEWVLIYNLGKIKIGNRATVSHKAHLCAGTHQYDDPTLPLIKPPIVIGREAWICSEAFIGPGVTVGDGAIVGARAVAVNDINPWIIVAGNPAKYVKDRVLRC